MADEAKALKRMAKALKGVAKALKGVILVITALVLWYVFAVLAQAVVVAVPALPGCLKDSGGFGCVFPWTHISAASSRTINWLVLVVSLIAALWAASRLVDPPDDFDTPKTR
jgi:hypothetical protein